MWNFNGDYIAVALAVAAAVLVLGLIGLLALAPLRIHLSLRPIVFALSAALIVGIGALGFWRPWALLLYAVALPLIALGVWDIFQKKHAALRNFPVLGHFRYLLEMIRPEIRQYFIESDTEEKPFSREKRSLVYQRAKGDLDTLPFGTKANVYEGGYEWITPFHRRCGAADGGAARSHRKRPVQSALLRLPVQYLRHELRVDQQERRSRVEPRGKDGRLFSQHGRRRRQPLPS